VEEFHPREEELVSHIEEEEEEENTVFLRPRWKPLRLPPPFPLPPLLALVLAFFLARSFKGEVEPRLTIFLLLFLERVSFLRFLISFSCWSSLQRASCILLVSSFFCRVVLNATASQSSSPSPSPLPLYVATISSTATHLSCT
jgi:hypothetical protein